MITARKLDIMQVEVDRQIEKLLEKFVRGHLGERMNDAQITNNQLNVDGRANGTEIHVETGRQPVRPGEEVQYDQRRNIRS